MGRKRFLTIVGSLMIGVISLIIVYLTLILTNVVVLTQADIEIKTADAYKEYDGKALSNNDWSISKGFLAQNHIIEMAFTGSQTDAGSSKNTAEVKIKTVNGKDVTKNYNITLIPGTLTVGKKPISIQSTSDEKEYDGTQLTNETYEVKSGSILDNHQIRATFENSITNAGSIDNVFTVRIVDDKARDVTENYDLTTTYGKLTVNKRKIEIQSKNATKEYDGKTLENSEYEVVNGSLVINHDIIFKSLVTATDVCKVENTFTVTIKDNLGVDQTKNYDIRYIYGMLEITKKIIRISTPSVTMVYNGQELSRPEYTISDLTPVVDGHTLTVNMTDTGISQVGSIINRPEFSVKDSEGNDVTSNYQLDEQFLGVLEIKPRTVTITSATDSKYYDGLPLTSPGYQINDATPIPVDHYIQISVDGTITEPGQTENHFACVILNAAREDVTWCFNIEAIYGTLTVKSSTASDTIIDKNPPSNNDSDTPLLVVTSNASGLVYLREYSKGDYTGKGFSGDVPIYNGDYIINPLYLAANALKESGYKESSISVKILDSAFDYHLPGYVTNADPYYANDFAIKHDFTIGLPYSLKYINYNFNSNKKATTYKYAAFEADYRKFVYENYLTLSENVLKELNKIIEENKINRNSSTLVEDVLKYVGSCAKYSKRFPAFPENCDIGLYFLTEAEYGICQHFATSATILFRALGIPARYTEGFACFTKANQMVNVTASDRHAWVEIYIDGMGWVAVDPTSYSVSADPSGSGGGGGSSDSGEPSVPASKIEINVTPESTRKEYDGTPLEPIQKVQISKNKLLEGHHAEVVVGGSQTEVGKGTSYVESFIVYDSEGKNVTDQYVINYYTGILHVYKSRVVIQIGSRQKTYDGSSLKADSFEVIDGLLPGHIIVESDVMYTGSITNVGRTLAGANYKVRDAATNEDVSDLYYCDVKYGVLEVKPIELIVEIGSAEKIYDGTPLVCHDFKWYPADPTCSLLPNHDVQIVFGDELTEVGYADNTAYDVQIIDIGYGDVTRNYKITIIDGILHVKPN